MKVHVLAHSVWRKRNRKALLEDASEREGGRQGGSVTLRAEGHQATLLRMRLTQAEQQRGELTTRCSC